jgi:hypothetical protein
LKSSLFYNGMWITRWFSNIKAGWYSLLGEINRTLMLQKSVVFFRWAAHWWKQYFVIRSNQFSNQLWEIILKYFRGHPRICISFIFVSSLLTFLKQRGLTYFPIARVVVYHYRPHCMQGVQ